jgi:hypothetical protein
MGYALKFAGIGIAFLLVGVLGLLIFDALWVRAGLGVAMVVFFGGILFWAWRQDQKAKASRAGLERI